MGVAIEPKKFSNWKYKYVRFADGKVLFCDGCDVSVCHADLKEEHPEAPPASAGAIGVRGRKWWIEDYGSTTLKLPGLSSDEKYIGKEMERCHFKMCQRGGED